MRFHLNERLVRYGRRQRTHSWRARGNRCFVVNTCLRLVRVCLDLYEIARPLQLELRRLGRLSDGQIR